MKQRVTQRHRQQEFICSHGRIFSQYGECGRDIWFQWLPVFIWARIYRRGEYKTMSLSSNKICHVVKWTCGDNTVSYGLAILEKNIQWVYLCGHYFNWRVHGLEKWSKSNFIFYNQSWLSWYSADCYAMQHNNLAAAFALSVAGLYSWNVFLQENMLGIFFPSDITHPDQMVSTIPTVCKTQRTDSFITLLATTSTCPFPTMAVYETCVKCSSPFCWYDSEMHKHKPLFHII